MWLDTAEHGRGFAAMVDAGDCLVVLPSTSELIAFQPNDKRYEQLAAIKVSDTATYAHPVLAGDRIFIKDEDTLILWTLR